MRSLRVRTPPRSPSRSMEWPPSACSCSRAQATGSRWCAWRSDRDELERLVHVHRRGGIAEALVEADRGVVVREHVEAHRRGALGAGELLGELHRLPPESPPGGRL